MLLEELIQSLQSVSEAEAVGLCLLLNSWIQSNESLKQLEEDVQIYLLKDATEGNKTSELWESFFNKSVRYISGMTMNERLVVFGLMDRADQADEHEWRVLYAKVHAKR
jgi:hypothetical protein